MEVPQKRPRSDEKIREEIREDMERSFDQFLDPAQETYITPSLPCKIEDVLGQLEQDVTSIKANLEKKRPKVTISQLNDKVDQILLILKKWES